MKLAFLNCRGLSNKLKRKSIFQLCIKFDICCLQETYITQEKALAWKSGWNGELFFSCGGQHSKGQVILIRAGLNVSSVSVTVNTERILGVKLSSEGQVFHIINVYAPVVSTEKRKFLSELSEIIDGITKEHGVDNLILCGDFNMVLDNELDIIAGDKHDLQCINAFNDFLALNELTDTWRYLNPQLKDFTWSRLNPCTARRLDYILCSENLITHIKDTQHLVCPVSDHKAVCLNITINDRKRGKGYWKMNDSLLNSPQYRDFMNEEIETFLKDHASLDSTYVWELLKVHIKEKTMSYSRKSANKYKMDLQDLESCLEVLSLKIKDNPSKEYFDRFAKLKTQLGVLQLEKARGAQIRSREKWIEDGEKNTAYFLGLERTRTVSNTVTSLKNLADTDTTNDPKEVLNIIQSYF